MEEKEVPRVCSPRVDLGVIGVGVASRAPGQNRSVQ